MSTVYIRKMRKNDDLRYIAEDEAPSVQELISDDVSELVRKSTIFLIRLPFLVGKDSPKNFLPTVATNVQFIWEVHFQLFKPLNSRLTGSRRRHPCDLQFKAWCGLKAWTGNHRHLNPKHPKGRSGGWVVGKHPNRVEISNGILVGFVLEIQFSLKG